MSIQWLFRITAIVLCTIAAAGRTQTPPAPVKPAEPPTILDTDREFSGGSRIALTSLTDAQVENLAALAEVWGFLKYHHPAITAGKRQWDFELFRIMPQILAAPSASQRNALLAAWVDSLGPIALCSPCAELNSSQVKLAPDLAWMKDERRWGKELSAKLQEVYRNRTSGPQFYVAMGRKGAANPDFLHEAAYTDVPFPDTGYQLLTLFRWWSTYEWWYPNRDLLPDLRQTLQAYIRPMGLAKSKNDFVLMTFKLVGEAHDTHANLWSEIGKFRPPLGICAVNAAFRWVEGKTVVWTVLDSNSGLKRGDVLESLDGLSVAALITEWRPYFDDSNEAARMGDITRTVTLGRCGPVKLGVVRGGTRTEIDSARIEGVFKNPAQRWHDRTGEAFQMLSPKVAYLKLSSVKIADAKSYVERAAGAEGMVIDIRNYPSGFVVFALGNLLAAAGKATFVRFSSMDEANPGAFRLQRDFPLQPSEPHYAGRIAILVDEGTLSQAEYTTMALRIAPQAAVVGSQTAGADGNVSPIRLPYNMTTAMSGLGVFTPSVGQTQGIGLARDVEATPTIVGIVAGRDEVLEAGLRWILGKDVPQAEIEALAKR